MEIMLFFELQKGGLFMTKKKKTTVEFTKELGERAVKYLEDRQKGRKPKVSEFVRLFPKQEQRLARRAIEMAMLLTDIAKN